ncbi:MULTISPECIES: branched-chain amino acid ABC transporter permease [Hyphomicrobiales]|jgi:branched-subunit amino acid ABC-type transport system permease component|uniref:branched-chain amino acid ABC transporter permease n=1 Tax=Hyphomicrobiales TaxID=356 RepID=UPI0003613E13|nr:MULTISPECIES: branched-chain amino acid ABC transporter permease [Phyllobacteriaceae]MCX8572936.1 branched-chain amino acid ABC transporter permease [Aminobacter sp. MET-1]
MVQFVVDVLIRAVDLALIAIGLSSVYSLIRFPNVALVQYATTGALLAFGLQMAGLPLVVAAITACALVGIIAVVLNVVVFERLLTAGSAIAMIGSLALSMVFSAVFLVTAGPRPQRFELEINPPLRFLGARLTEHQLISVGISALAIGAFALILFRTDLGRCMRATATNSVLASATGIDTRKVTNTVVFLSGVMAALGGIGLSVKGEMSAQLGLDMLLPVFAAAILGGLGNALGAAVGAVVIASAETLVTNVNFGPLFGQSMLFIPAAYATAASFLLLVVVLLVKPYGLFVSEVKRV